MVALRRLFQRTTVAAVALTMVGATVASAQQQPESGLGIRLLEAPSARADDPRARSYIVDHVKPGTTFSRRFEVSNGRGRPIGVDLYDGAARLEDGSFVPEARGAENRLTEWMTVTPGKVDVASGQRAAASVSIAVPTDAPEGEYYGAVWAEIPGDPPPGGGFAVASRVGIRVYLDVGAGEEAPTDFQLETFVPSLGEDGRPGVDIRTCSSGGRAVDLSGELTLTEGPGGVSAGPFEGENRPTLAPGQCADVVVRLAPAIPRGPWKATVTLRSGREQRAATGTITFPSDPGSAAAPVKAEPKDVTGTTGGRTALVIAIVLLLLVGLLLLFLLWRRRRSRGPGEPGGSGPSVG